MLKKILIASLAAVMVMSVSAFAAEGDEADTGAYNQYGLSTAAMDVLTIPMNEGTAKYPVSEVIPNGDYNTVIYQNGFIMDYYDGWTDLFTDTDEGGKNLFYYFDITLPTVDDIATLLASNGYNVLYEIIEASALPVNTCAVDPDSQSVMINAGFTDALFWDIDSDGQGKLTISHSYSDNTEAVNDGIFEDDID